MALYAKLFSFRRLRSLTPNPGHCPWTPVGAFPQTPSTICPATLRTCHRSVTIPGRHRYRFWVATASLSHVERHTVTNAQWARLGQIRPHQLTPSHARMSFNRNIHLLRADPLCRLTRIWEICVSDVAAVVYRVGQKVNPRLFLNKLC